MGRRRSIKRRHWPAGLREPRPGYFAWDGPQGCMAIGRVSEAEAIRQVYEVTAHLQQQRASLVDKLRQDGKTIAALIERMPKDGARNTLKSHRSLDKIIAAKLGSVPAEHLTVAQCAELIAGIVEAGQHRSAQAVRSRLSAICKEGMALGWMDRNPAAATRNPKAEVQRARLTLEMWKLIYEQAPKVDDWLPLAMRLAIVTAQDVSTISAMCRSDIKRDGPDPVLFARRRKTKEHSDGILIPLRLRLDVLGLTLADVLALRSSIASRYIVHHTESVGLAKIGDQVPAQRISKAFTKARRMAGIPDTVDGKNAPTFHEQRSLAARLYTDQGGVNVQALLDHSTADMTAIYQDDRGLQPKLVQVG